MVSQGARHAQILQTVKKDVYGLFEGTPGDDILRPPRQLIRDWPPAAAPAGTDGPPAGGRRPDPGNWGTRRWNSGDSTNAGRSVLKRSRTACTHQSNSAWFGLASQHSLIEGVHILPGVNRDAGELPARRRRHAACPARCRESARSSARPLSTPLPMHRAFAPEPRGTRR